MPFFQLVPTAAPPPEISTTSANFTVPDCASAPPVSIAANAATNIVFLI